MSAKQTDRSVSNDHFPFPPPLAFPLICHSTTTATCQRLTRHVSLFSERTQRQVLFFNTGSNLKHPSPLHHALLPAVTIVYPPLCSRNSLLPLRCYDVHRLFAAIHLSPNPHSTARPSLKDMNSAFDAVATLALKDHLPSLVAHLPLDDQIPTLDWHTLPAVTLEDYRSSLQLPPLFRDQADHPIKWARDLAISYGTIAALTTWSVGLAQNPRTERPLYSFFPSHSSLQQASVL